MLVDQARPERLGELVRALLPAHPGLEVHTDAVRLARVDRGALVILVADARQADWLNMERPIFANLALRVILFSDAETSGALARRAPDFFNWISHRVECPPGLPPTAVRGIRAALRTRAQGVAWTGGDFAAAFQAALPGRPLARASAALPYDQMVEAAKPAGKGWVAWSEVDGPFRLRRVRWACAEAGRRGRVALIEPAVDAAGFAPVRGDLLGVVEARAKLEAAGATHPGRVAALLELEPEAVEVAARLLRGRVAEGAIEEAVVGVGDPGVAVARLAVVRRVEVGKGLRARADGVGEVARDAAEVALRAGRGAERWVEGAAWASNADDADVAVRWARQALVLSEDDPEALRLLGRVLMQRGEPLEAEALLRRLAAAAEQRWSLGTDDITVLTDLANLVQLQGKYLDAEKLLRRALAAQKKVVGVAHPDYAFVLHSLALVLRDRGRYEEAEEMLRQAAAIIKRAVGKEHFQYASTIGALGAVLMARGKFPAAESMIRESLAILARAGRAETAEYVTALHGIGRILLERGKVAEAEVQLREAIALEVKILGEGHPIYGQSLHELARCLSEQGKYDEADKLLRRALSILEKSFGTQNLTYAASLHELAGILRHRGEYESAERLYGQVLDIEEASLGRKNPVLCATLGNLAFVLAMQGRTAEGETLVRRAVDIAEKMCGPRHPDTANSLYILAQFEARRGSADAPETARRALKALNHALGPNNPLSKSAAALVEQLSPRGTPPPSTSPSYSAVAAPQGRPGRHRSRPA